MSDSEGLVASLRLCTGEDAHLCEAAADEIDRLCAILAQIVAGRCDAHPNYHECPTMEEIAIVAKRALENSP